jgi:hypothetical protein
MVRTVVVPGDQVKVLVDIGPGLVVRAILVIEDPSVIPNASKVNGGDDDPFGKELDDLLAMSPPNEHPADVSREAMYLTDEEMGYRQV